MADKLSVQVSGDKGLLGIDKWMQVHVTSQPSINKGFEVTCFDLNGNETKQPVNQIGILLEDCKFMRQGTDSNHGFGGSNCTTGNPVCFVDVLSVLPAVHKRSTVGILTKYKPPCFVLPLAMLDEAPDLVTLMNDAYVNFVAMRFGDNLHNITHVANGISSCLAAICFALCSEITLKGSKPDAWHASRLKFLVEALFVMGLTARSAASYSQDCRKIFTLLPKMASTTDTFQSVLIAFIFNQVPCQAICAKMLGSSIFRYFNNNTWNTSYIDKNPVGLIGLLLIAPMLANLISKDIETTQVINTIVRSINESIISITEECRRTDFHALSKRTPEKIAGPMGASGLRPVHLQNKQILRGFAKATKVPFVQVEYVDKIYDAVLDHSKDVAKAIGIVENIGFVNYTVQLLLNNKVCDNFPVLIQTDQKTDSAMYIPADPREWTGVSLKPFAVYLFEAETLGIAKFKQGTTVGEQNIANFRFTAGKELLSGKYKGYAATGMYYDPVTRRFTEAHDHSKIDPNKSFKIVTNDSGITVYQDDHSVLQISCRPADDTISPLICFKFCSAKITLVQRTIPPQVASSQTESKTAPNKSENGSEVGPEIDSCLSLTESLAGLRVKDSARRTMRGKHDWGKSLED